MSAAGRRSTSALRARGFTLVELMVGLAVGLMLMAGAFAMAGVQLGEHHRLMLELQVQQELRATAALMLRDLRRAAFWDKAQDGLWQLDGPAPIPNPYVDLSMSDPERLSYSYARDNGTAAGSVRETSGFRLSDGRIDQLIAGRYQPLTDPAVLRVLRFEARLLSAPQAVGDACGTSIERRLVELSMEAEATHDRRVHHRFELLALLRNDAMTGGCA